MKQQTLAVAVDQNAQYERYRRPTKRDEFLASMERLVPWGELCSVIEPHYPKAGNGRPPVGLQRMLRMHFVQHWFNLADEACEEALLDSTALRRFVGIDLGRERVPDATTLLNFRRLLETHELGKMLFAKVGEVLQAKGLRLGTGTIVDATIIGAPSSTKNKDKQRDPEMHQTRKGQQWYFGMKLHIGVDSQTGLVHSAVVTAANVHDKRNKALTAPVISTGDFIALPMPDTPAPMPGAGGADIRIELRRGAIVPSPSTSAGRSLPRRTVRPGCATCCGQSSTWEGSHVDGRAHTARLGFSARVNSSG